MRKISRIVVHCSATKTGNAAAFRRYHMQVNGWNDIGYHYVILRSGIVEKGRPIEKAGAHCPEANKDSIGICLVGIDQFEAAQFDALKKLYKELTAKFGKLAVSNHHDFASAKRIGKTCPNFDARGILK